MWVIWEMLSLSERPSTTSLPRYRATTSSMVRGMPPRRISVKEFSTIIMNTTPLAPSSAVPGKKMNCTSPVTRAVTRMVISRLRLPYFSSKPGPTSNSSSILFM